MKNIVLKYGTISGLITGLIMFASTLYENKYGFDTTPAFVGYLGIVVVFIPLYMGIKSFRQSEGGGYITFMKAMNVGVVTVAVSAVFYAISKLLIFYCLTPDYPEKYSAYIVHVIKSSGLNLQDTVPAKQQMVQLKEMTKNPLIFGANEFTFPLPLGIIMTLICAAILRKKPPAIELKELS